MLSALIALFAQSLSAEMVRYERLDEVIPHKPIITIPTSLYRGGMVMIREKGVLSHIRMVQAAIILPPPTLICFAYT